MVVSTQARLESFELRNLYLHYRKKNVFIIFPQASSPSLAHTRIAADALPFSCREKI